MVGEEQTVEGYRLDQLEKQLAAFKAERGSLSFGQIKQMFAWLGLPVVVATGVFGAALWQLIDTKTISAAEQRARTEVEKITRNIDALDQRVTALAERAQATIVDLGEIKGRADASAITVRDRVLDARASIALAENELSALRARIAAIPDVSSLTGAIEDAAANVAGTQGFRDRVTERVLENFRDLVAAFDVDQGCPAGWVWRAPIR